MDVNSLVVNSATEPQVSSRHMAQYKCLIN